MKNKRIIPFLSTLLILAIIVNPVAIAATSYQISVPAAAGTAENMIVNVFEDESVTSNNPTTNFDGNEAGGGIWVGYEPFDGYTRAWLKYDLSNIPKEIGILSVHITFYCMSEFVTTEDLPIGIYYSEDDSWSETAITWNNQPDFDTLPTDIIDSPPSPDMFVPDNWYSWDVTDPFTDSLANDKILTLVLKQIDEVATNMTWIYFVEKDYDPFFASYLYIEYTTPEAVDLKVDGQNTAPLINYIQKSTPALRWTMYDSGTGEYQRDYALEVNSNQYFNETELWSLNHTSKVTIHDSSTGNNLRPFGTRAEFRYQMKYNTSLLTTSGIVDKLYFETVAEIGTIIFENLVVLLVCTDTTGPLTSDFQANYGSATPTVVLNRSLYSAEIKDYHFSIDVENTFFLNARQDLIYELRFTNNTGTTTTTRYTMDIGGSVAYTFGAGAYRATTATTTDNRANSLAVELMSDEAFISPGPNSNAFPFNTDNGYPGTVQMKFNQSLITDTGIIDRIYFVVTSFSGDVVFEGLKVYLAETPILGRLNHLDFSSNYGGVTPTLVLDEDVYQIRNVGGALVIDVSNTFYYHGQHDLLVELTWENKVSGGCNAYRTTGGGAYRAHNVTWGSHYNNNDTVSYDTIFDFAHTETTVEYAGTPLVNETIYYWRVKTCDSTGIWSDWTSLSFRYEPLESTPDYSTPVVSPVPAYAGNPVTISLNVTYFLGLYQVLIEMDGSNHSMTVDGDTYSYTWTPSAAGSVNYTIYMESNIHTWSSVSDTAIINASILGIDPTLLLIIAGVGVAAVVIILVLVKARGKK